MTSPAAEPLETTALIERLRRYVEMLDRLIGNGRGQPQLGPLSADVEEAANALEAKDKRIAELEKASADILVLWRRDQTALAEAEARLAAPLPGEVQNALDDLSLLTVRIRAEWFLETGETLDRVAALLRRQALAAAPHWTAEQAIGWCAKVCDDYTAKTREATQARENRGLPSALSAARAEAGRSLASAIRAIRPPSTEGSK